MQVFGRTGTGPSEFGYPRAAVADRAGHLFVVDKTGRIQRFDEHGRFETSWRMPETSAGKPTGLGRGSDGRIYAADTHYARVLVFDADGRELTRFGTFGEGAGQLKLPTDVAVDSTGNIYVSEYGGNDRVSCFSPRFEFQFSFGGRDDGEASMERPQSLLVAPDDSIWVVDACRHRICHFGKKGEFLASFGRLGSALGELRFPYNVDMLSDGTLVVSEYGNNRVQRFAVDGRSLGTWGRAGREPGELAYPWALAVLTDDQIAIVDSGNNRIQVIDGRSAATWNAK